VKKPKATWVEPVLQAEIEFSALTADKKLRAPVFKGIREDLLEKPRAGPHSDKRSKGLKRARKAARFAYRVMGRAAGV
jgi:bifunctional non-homologous end joining protein LigD